jgi:hypothetical protein
MLRQWRHPSPLGPSWAPWRCREGPSGCGNTKSVGCRRLQPLGLGCAFRVEADVLAGVNRTPGAAIRSRFRFGGIERLAVRVSVIDHRTVVTVRALGGAGIDRPQQTLVPSETIFQADAAATTDGPSAANRGPTQPLSSPFRRASATGLSWPTVAATNIRCIRIAIPSRSEKSGTSYFQREWRMVNASYRRS